MVTDSQVEITLRCAHAIAYRFTRSRSHLHQDMEDAKSVATVAVYMARKRYVEGGEATFLTFAISWVKAELNRWWSQSCDARCHEQSSDAEFAWDEDEVDSEEVDKMVHNISMIFRLLDPRERLVIGMLFGINLEKKSSAGIAKMLRMTRQNVHLIQRAAIDKLQRYLVGRCS